MCLLNGLKILSDDEEYSVGRRGVHRASRNHESILYSYLKYA